MAKIDWTKYKWHKDYLPKENQKFKKVPPEIIETVCTFYRLNDLDCKKTANKLNLEEKVVQKIIDKHYKAPKIIYLKELDIQKQCEVK